MRLPPFPFEYMSIAALVRFGVISRITAREYMNVRYPYERAKANGEILMANHTELAIAFWVPLGATLDDIMKYSHGTCNPDKIEGAVRAFGSFVIPPNAQDHPAREAGSGASSC
jgi:hypothetical protein